MGKETVRRIVALIAVAAVVCLGAFGISRALAGPTDQDLGEGFIIKNNTHSPTTGVPNEPTHSPRPTDSKTAKPTPSISATPKPSSSSKKPSPKPTATVKPKPKPPATAPPKKTVTPLPPSGNQNYDDDDDDESDDDDEADDIDDDD